MSQTVIIAASRSQARRICRDAGLNPASTVVVTPGHIDAVRGTHGRHCVGLDNLEHFSDREAGELRFLALTDPSTGFPPSPQ